MVWKGIIFKESIEGKSLLDLVKIIEIGIDKRENKSMTFYKVEVEDNKKDEFVQKTIKSLKQGYYIHIVKDKVIYVIFKNHMFKFNKGYPELETARNYGKSIGIPEKQMPFELLISYPFG